MPTLIPGHALLLIGPTTARYGRPLDPRTVHVAAWEAPYETIPHNTLRLDHHTVPELVADAVPLFALVPTLDGWLPYTQTSYSGLRSLMLMLDGPPLPDGDPRDLDTLDQWLRTLVQRHRLVGPQANNHQRWFINARPGLELEHKFTLPEQIDIWQLAVHILKRLRGGTIPGWVCEFGNNDGFEEWDFPTHVFAFDQPPGHIAFIPAVDGTWIRREKWDGPGAPLIRREELTSGLLLGAHPDLEAAAKDSAGRSPDWSGGYRRIRYNVMAESPETGHIFSIMVDHCIDLDGRQPDLRQVEVEYVRSRTLRRLPFNADGVMEQLQELIAWTRSYLQVSGVKAVEDDQSKVSWLRSAAPAAEHDRPP
ncbi:hypothetical protein ACQEVF_58820 [Nonomuraea polychroma]|uniref:hypothetical protein n=1 Tax=Nonomuraea polychroma TaxID=46176 RepID=UPI003D89BEE6